MKNLVKISCAIIITGCGGNGFTQAGTKQLCDNCETGGSPVDGDSGISTGGKTSVGSGGSTGGHTGSGGHTALGGAGGESSTGGTSSTGGMTSSGGSSSTGGVTSSGGNDAGTGGTTACIPKTCEEIALSLSKNDKGAEACGTIADDGCGNPIDCMNPCANTFPRSLAYPLNDAYVQCGGYYQSATQFCGVTGSCAYITTQTPHICGLSCIMADYQIPPNPLVPGSGCSTLIFCDNDLGAPRNGCTKSTIQAPSPSNFTATWCCNP